MTTPDHAKSAAFILTHKRPDRVHTWNLLQRSGWKRPIYLIVDNEDPTVDEYRQRFGSERVIMFDKAAVAETFDTADTQTDRRAIVYARNASFDIAEQLGLDYFWQLDDDYLSFEYRVVEGDRLLTSPVRNVDALFEAMMTFLDSSGAMTIALSQGGDHIGGVEGRIKYHRLLRKAMNTFVLRTDRRFDFVGRINEDVNTYVTEGARGNLFFTIVDVMIRQVQTQSSAGGMSDLYHASGTYLKSFYTVMMHPSSVTVRTMGQAHRRFHHHIRWSHTVPCILNETHRKT